MVPSQCSNLVCDEFFLCFLRGKQGSGPNRGQSPVEWVDFPSKLSGRLSVHPSVHPSVGVCNHYKLSDLAGEALGLAS